MIKTVRAFMYSVGADGITGQPIQFSFGGNNGDGEAASASGILDVESYPMLLNSAGTFDRRRAAVDNADAVAVGSLGIAPAMARAQLYNGASWDRARTPNSFHAVSTVAAGSTALWTPAAGKKFRLMGYSILITEAAIAAVAGELLVSLTDGAALLPFSHVGSIGTTAGPSPMQSNWCTLGNGYLSSAANNVMSVNLSFALTGGTVRVIVAGTEE